MVKRRREQQEQQENSLHSVTQRIEPRSQSMRDLRVCLLLCGRCEPWKASSPVGAQCQPLLDRPRVSTLSAAALGPEVRLDASPDHTELVLEMQIRNVSAIIRAHAAARRGSPPRTDHWHRKSRMWHLHLDKVKCKVFHGWSSQTEENSLPFHGVKLQEMLRENQKWLQIGECV